jgi:hypothetical protein
MGTAGRQPARDSVLLGDLMRRIVEFQLDQGGSVLVEVTEPPGAFIAAVAAEANFNVSSTWRRDAAGT